MKEKNVKMLVRNTTPRDQPLQLSVIRIVKIHSELHVYIQETRVMII